VPADPGTHPFVRPAPQASPRVRLVVFPHAGGSGAAYHALRDGLPADWDLLLLDLPGRGRRHRETPLEDMAALVRLVAADVLPWAGPPLALLGHSLGGILAVEVARALEGRGVEVGWVGVSGRSAPGSAGPRSRLPDLPDEGLLAALGAMGGLPDRLAALPDFRRQLLRVVRSDLRAADSYRPPGGPRLRAPVTAFAGSEDTWAPPSAVTGWVRETAGAFRFRTFPGGHFYFSGAFGAFSAAVVDEVGRALAARAAVGTAVIRPATTLQEEAA